MPSRVRMSCWAPVISVRWRKVPAGPAKVPDGDAAELAAQFRPGTPGGVLCDAGQQEGEPAQVDVSADPLLFPVVYGPEVDDLLHVAPAALDLQELPVAQRDVLGGHLRVGGAQQVLAVEVLLGPGLAGVDAQEAAGGDAQVAVQPGPGGDDAAQL